MRYLLALTLIALVSFTAPWTNESLTKCLDIQESQIVFDANRDSFKQLPGRIAETDGETIWIHPDRVSDLQETLIHEVAHIKTWTPNDWHGPEWESTYNQLMEECYG